MIFSKAVLADTQKLPAQFVGKYSDLASLPAAHAVVAVIGRSNSGKSSLLRALLSCAVPPRVSAQPGSTKLLYGYAIQKNRESGVLLLDFPGYGYAKERKALRGHFHAMLAEYLEQGKRSGAVFLVMDCRRKLAEEERAIAAICNKRQVPILLILNKADQLSQAELANLRRHYADSQPFLEVLLVSATHRWNLEYLRNFVLSR